MHLIFMGNRLTMLIGLYLTLKENNNYTGIET
jgi:hypothetical protein